MSKRIRVVIADDHPVVRTGLRLMLSMRETFELVGEAVDGASAIRLTDELRPDVVLLDLRMPGIDGISALEHIHREWPAVAVIILTTYNEDDLLIRGLRAGARGYLLKDADIEVLLQAIERAAHGETLIQPEVMQRILLHAERAVTSRAPKHPGPDLTQRELDVLAGVARGERTKEIARRLGVSERTAWAYLTSIYNKLGVDSRASAVAVAMERQLLPPQT
ncbi:MAG TPA: response regulator transcription factor [Ktedonobacteraceae bacterium]